MLEQCQRRQLLLIPVGDLLALTRQSWLGEKARRLGTGRYAGYRSRGRPEYRCHRADRVGQSPISAQFRRWQALGAEGTVNIGQDGWQLAFGVLDRR
jgi:hypothetical protein